MWGPIVRALHALPPERAHKMLLAALRMSPTIYDALEIGEPASLLGLSFPNRVGLAAGFDKNGDHVDSLAKLGFGFIEVGTITPRPQAGSPKPRLFRVPAEKAVINRMGFNNLGVEHAAKNLARQDRIFAGVLGCNIGCNSDTPPDDAIGDFLVCLRRLYGLADYYVANVSSPNTPGLRKMLRPLRLKALLDSLEEGRDKLISNHRVKSPIFLKVAPDLDEGQVEALAEIIAESGINGIVATSTTTSRPLSVSKSPYGGQPGGLSGEPLRGIADRSVAAWRKHLPAKMAIIGVGGVFTGDDAKAKATAGADLVQVHTGLTYQGPALVPDCARALAGSTAAA